MQRRKKGYRQVLKREFRKRKRYLKFAKKRKRIPSGAEKRVQEAKTGSQICKEEKLDTLRN